MDAIKGTGRPQHRHAAAARPGLRGAHRAPRRLRRAAGAGRTTDVNEQPMDGWEVLEQAGELARRGEEFALATVVWRQGPSSGPAGLARDHHRRRRAARLDRRRLRRAGRHPRGAAGRSRDGEPRLLLLGTPEQFGAAVPDGMTVDPDLLPERGRAGGLHRAGAAGAAPRRRRPLADGAHAGRPGRRARLARRRSSTAPTSPPADVDARSIVVVATQGHGDEEALEQAVAARPAYVGLVASRDAGRGRARLPRRPGRAAGPARPGAGAGRARPRPHHPPGDRGRHPGRAGPAAGVRRAGRPRSRPARPRGRCRPSAARRVDRPGLRDDRGRRRRQPPAASTTASTYYFCCAGCRQRVRAGPCRLPARRRPDADQERLRGRRSRSTRSGSSSTTSRRWPPACRAPS